jgi:hypothetical protein
MFASDAISHCCGTDAECGHRESGALAPVDFIAVVPSNGMGRIGLCLGSLYRGLPPHPLRNLNRLLRLIGRVSAETIK